MKILFLFLVLNFDSFAQDSELQFIEHVNNAIDTFAYKSPQKYKLIKGIDLIFDTLRGLISYRITFEKKYIRLTKNEYYWLLKEFKKRNLAKYVIEFYPMDQYVSGKMLIAVPYKRKVKIPL